MIKWKRRAKNQRIKSKQYAHKTVCLLIHTFRLTQLQQNDNTSCSSGKIKILVVKFRFWT